jgi:hypothetical protein
MDKLNHYRDIITRLIREYASYRPSNGQIETEVVIDRDNDHYEVLHVGWDGVRRVHGSVVHGAVRRHHPPHRRRARRRRHP